jgi:hypothetical protein
VHLRVGGVVRERGLLKERLSSVAMVDSVAMASRLGLAVFISVQLVACGEVSTLESPANTLSADPPASASAGANIIEQTPAQHKVAHFRTSDGVVALVLDRSGDPPKYQLDGTADIVELTVKEDRESWGRRLQGYYLVAPDGRRPFFIDEEGSITYSKGYDHYDLMFDKDVGPLGAATVRAALAPPAQALKATTDRLSAIAVRTRFPQFKAEDSANLAKVGEALSHVTADMFVHYASHGQSDWLPNREVVPQEFSGVEFGGVDYHADELWDPKTKAPGLAKFGGRNEGFSDWNAPKGNHMQVLTLEGYPPKLADGTPGVVWELDGTHATFVALDGGRYRVDLSRAGAGQTLDRGAGPRRAWPPPARDALLTVPDVSSLAKAGAVPQKNADDLIALDREWTKCAAGVWAGAQYAIETRKLTEAHYKDYVKKARSVCASTINKQEALLVAIVQSRLADRMALYAKARARAVAVGGDH